MRKFSHICLNLAPVSTCTIIIIVGWAFLPDPATVLEGIFEVSAFNPEEGIVLEYLKRLPRVQPILERIIDTPELFQVHEYTGFDLGRS